MCFSQGTITATASDLLQSQLAGRPYEQSLTRTDAEGAAIGALVGSLISAWIDHHRRVKAEEKALKQELIAYLNAEIEVFRENKRLNEDTAEQMRLLKDLDKSNAQMWERGEQQAREGLLPLAEKQIQLTVNYHDDVDKNFMSRKGLEYALNDTKAGAKTMYELALKLAAVSDVINQLYRAVVGYYQNQSHPRVAFLMQLPHIVDRQMQSVNS
jgi:hypothetical protein